MFGHCESRSGIAAFDRLVGDVMGREPYRSARRVFWIVDNGSSHRGELGGEHPEIGGELVKNCLGKKRSILSSTKHAGPRLKEWASGWGEAPQVAR